MSLFRQFQDVVARAPEAVVVRHRDRTCSYAGLEARAARLAGRLPRKGRDGLPGAFVVLLDGDPIAEIAAVLGIVATGGVAVPVDAGQPPVRLGQVIAHCQPTAILAADAARVSADAAAVGAAVLPVGDDPGHSPPPLPTVADDALAYVCYTSGTTGDSKGVVATHAQIARSVAAGAESSGFGPRDRHTLLHGLDTGAGRATLWRALLTGGTLLPWRVRDEGVAGMRAWLEREGATVLFSSPTLFRTFTASLAADERLTTVRLLRLGGERVMPPDVAAFKRHLRPDAMMVNTYSITEAANVASYVITHDTVIAGDSVPVGRPRAGCRVTICDDEGRELPAGEVGEIQVEGPYLAAGYWRGAALAPAGVDQGATARYRTGDLGFVDGEGLLHHAGRRDSQVKIRGYRVELGAVEAALERAPGVIRCAALVVGAAGGDQQLVACVAADRRVTDEAALHAHAAAQLPRGSVPSRFVLLDAMPLGPSGKVDRRALARRCERPPPLGPSTDWSARPAGERHAAHIWAALLGHDRFGPDDDFAIVGGDSLLAMHVVTRIQRELDVDVEWREFQAAPTVAALGALLDDRLGEQRRQDEVELARLLDEIDRA